MSDLPHPNFGLALVGDDPVSFMNFPELPPEIRLMIWELLVSEDQLSFTPFPSTPSLYHHIRFATPPRLLR